LHSHGAGRGASFCLAGVGIDFCFEQQLWQTGAAVSAWATGNNQQHQPIGINTVTLHTATKIPRRYRTMLLLCGADDPKVKHESE
jgi:hypothetical protein